MYLIFAGRGAPAVTGILQIDHCGFHGAKSIIEGIARLGKARGRSLLVPRLLKDP